MYNVAADQVESVLPQLAFPADMKQSIRDKAKPGGRLRLPAATITPAQYRPVYVVHLVRSTHRAPPSTR